MDRRNPFYRQASLVVRVLPHVARREEFALKGGTAINLFLRDLPRLSVDIDLTRWGMVPFHGTQSLVTDQLRSYGAALKELGLARRQTCGGRTNNRAENSHQPFRRRERAMAQFRDIKTLQKFAAAHAPIYNHFNLERHLIGREIFKTNRAAAMAEWRQLVN